MGVPEGNTMIDQIICCIRCIGKTMPRTVIHPLPAEMDRIQHTGKQRNTAFYRIYGIKHQFFVFLHILIVSQRNSLQSCQQRHEGTVYSAGLAPHQLCNIRILLLGHDGASGAVRIIDLHKTVFIAVPEDDLLAETAQMHHNHRHGRQVLHQIIPVRYRVHTVEHGTGKSQKLRCVLPVQRIGRPRKSAGAQRKVVHPFMNIPQTGTISFEHLKICSHVMCQRNRLCLLQMCEPRHDRLCVLFHDAQKHLQKLLQKFIRLQHLRSRIETHIQRHLVIPAPARVQLLACVPDPVDQIRLHKAVDILIFLCDRKLSGFHILKYPPKTFQNRITLRLRQDPLLRQHPHVSHTALYVLPVKFLIKRN